jgi:hypothetical protein
VAGSDARDGPNITRHFVFPQPLRDAPRLQKGSLMKKPSKRGPKPETVVIEGDWKDAVKQALAKGKPPKKAVAKKKRRPK